MSQVEEWSFLDYPAYAYVNGYINIKTEDALANPHLASLYGYVYNHPLEDRVTGEFADGHRIVTSSCKEINLEERYVITRSGSRYTLAGPPGGGYTPRKT